MFHANDEIYILIGKIGMGMEQVHNSLALIASNICSQSARNQQVQQSLSATLSLRQLTDFTEMLYLSTSESIEGKKQLKTLVSRIRQLEQKRNGIIHSVWIPSGEEGIHKKFKFSRDKQNGVKVSNERIKVEDFKCIAEECEKLNSDLCFFVFDDNKREGSPFHVVELSSSTNKAQN